MDTVSKTDRPNEEVQTTECMVDACGDHNRNTVLVSAQRNKAEFHGYQWMNDMKLEQGSPIDVAVASKASYWVWERSGPNEDLWSFRSRLLQDLFITASDELNNVTMQARGDNSYFHVILGYQGGYFVKVPKKNKFFAVSDGKLSLSTIPVEWSLSLPRSCGAGPTVGVVKIMEGVLNSKWICDYPVPETSVTVGLDHGQEDKTLWIARYLVNEGAYHFLPKENDKIYVTCNVSESEILLQTETDENTRARLIAGNRYDEQKVIMTNVDDATKYFYVKKESEDYSMLAMIGDEADATHWSVRLAAFKIEGMVTPKFCRSECEIGSVQQTDTQASLSQESQSVK